MTKNHSAPAPDILTGPREGGVNYYQRGFNWPKAISKALEKKKYRSIQLARINKDYQIKYPNECRDNPDGKIVIHCHPEAEKRILKEHEKMLRLAIVPTVDRPKRLNRLG